MRQYGKFSIKSTLFIVKVSLFAYLLQIVLADVLVLKLILKLGLVSGLINLTDDQDPTVFLSQIHQATERALVNF